MTDEEYCFILEVRSYLHRVNALLTALLQHTDLQAAHLRDSIEARGKLADLVEETRRLSDLLERANRVTKT